MTSIKYMNTSLMLFECVVSADTMLIHIIHEPAALQAGLKVMTLGLQGTLEGQRAAERSLEVRAVAVASHGEARACGGTGTGAVLPCVGGRL